MDCIPSESADRQYKRETVPGEALLLVCQDAVKEIVSSLFSAMCADQIGLLAAYSDRSSGRSPFFRHCCTLRIKQKVAMKALLINLGGGAAGILYMTIAI